MDIMYPATVMPLWPPPCLYGHHGMARCCFDTFMAIIHPSSLSSHHGHGVCCHHDASVAIVHCGVLTAPMVLPF